MILVAARERSAARVPGTRSIRSAVALVLVVLGLLAGCVSTVTPQDVRQQDKPLSAFSGPDFTVQFPGVPDETTRTVATASGDLEVVFYTVVSKDAAISVAVTTAPAGVTLDLDGAVDGAAADVNGTVSSSNPVTVGSDEGRDGLILASRDGANLGVYFRMVASGQRLVQIQQVVTGTELGNPPANYQQIVDSLTLT